MTQVLVLNQDYQAISVCDPKQAFVLVWLGKAEMVAERPDRKLRTSRKAFDFPAVIRLRRYVNLPYRPVPLTRHNIYRRDGYACVYCGTKQELTLDHVLPKAQGGGSKWTNLVTACRSCNAEKADRTPQEAGMSLLRQPYRPGFFMFLHRFSGDMHETWKPFLYIT